MKLALISIITAVLFSSSGSFARDHRGGGGTDFAGSLERWEAEETAAVETLAENALTSRDQAPPDPDQMLGDVFAGD